MKKVKLHTANNIKIDKFDSISIIKTNLVTANIKKRMILNIINLEIKSNGERSRSRYLLTKEYHPQKATKRIEAIFEGSMRKDRIEDAIYTPKADDVPNSISIKVTTNPHIAQDV